MIFLRWDPPKKNGIHVKLRFRYRRSLDGFDAHLPGDFSGWSVSTLERTWDDWLSNAVLRNGWSGHMETKWQDKDGLVHFRGVAVACTCDVNGVGYCYLVCYNTLQVDNGWKSCHKCWTLAVTVNSSIVATSGGGELKDPGPIWERYLGSQLSPGSYTITVTVCLGNLYVSHFVVVIKGSLEGLVLLQAVLFSRGRRVWAKRGSSK